MALAPPLVITIGLITLLAIAGYWLMKPTVHTNPGVAAYAPPAAAKVLGYAWEDKSAAVDRAANEVAEGENKKLGLAPPVVAGGQGQQDLVAQPSAVAAAPRQTTRAARTQRRQDASAQSRSRFPPREPAPYSAFARGWFGRW
jgi:hypothetical protein